MNISITLNDRLYKDILLKSSDIGVEVNTYISRLIEERFYIEKYGDLNEISNQSNKTDKESIDIQKNIKKSSRKAKKDEIVENNVEVKEIDKSDAEIISENEKNNKDIDSFVQQNGDDVLKKIVKRTRVLKSK